MSTELTAKTFYWLVADAESLDKLLDYPAWKSRGKVVLVARGKDAEGYWHFRAIEYPPCPVLAAPNGDISIKGVKVGHIDNLLCVSGGRVLRHGDAYSFN